MQHDHSTCSTRRLRLGLRKTARQHITHDELNQLASSSAECIDTPPVDLSGQRCERHAERALQLNVSSSSEEGPSRMGDSRTARPLQPDGSHVRQTFGHSFSRDECHHHVARSLRGQASAATLCGLDLYQPGRGSWDESSGACHANSVETSGPRAGPCGCRVVVRCP